MYIIGENIHIISPSVKKALADRDAEFFKKSAIQQVEMGASAVDLNLGRQKHEWEEVFPWVTKIVQEVVDVPLCIDSTNLDGIEAALKVITKARPIINSTSAEAERLEQVPLLAKKYDAQLIALTLKKEGIPVEADERVNIALEYLIPRAMEVGIEMPDLIIDPLGSDCLRMPGILSGIDRSRSDNQVCWRSSSLDLGWFIECVQCCAGRNPPDPQPGLSGHVNGRRVGNDDRGSL